ncbi:site-specific integrase, partial [Streptococcus suis]
KQCNHILSKDDFLFRVAYDTYKRFGEPIRVGYLQTLFSKVNNQLGSKVSPHMMRHFFATQGVIAGVPIAHMAAALG